MIKTHPINLESLTTYQNEKNALYLFIFIENLSKKDESTN